MVTVLSVKTTETPKTTLEALDITFVLVFASQLLTLNIQVG